MVHTFHATPIAGDVVTQAQLIDTADKVQAAWSAALAFAPPQSRSMAGIMAQSTVYTSAVVYNLDGFGKAESQGEKTFGPGVRSGNGGPALPTEVALCVTQATASSGKRFRGRTYLGGLASSSLTGAGRFDPSVIEAAAGGMATFIRQCAATANLRLGVLSVTGGVITPITSCKAGDVADVQRRRRDSLRETRAAVAV
jgi:hypothetical protein